jgi:hypothetical protein
MIQSYCSTVKQRVQCVSKVLAEEGSSRGAVGDGGQRWGQSHPERPADGGAAGSASGVCVKAQPLKDWTTSKKSTILAP